MRTHFLLVSFVVTCAAGCKPKATPAGGSRAAAAGVVAAAVNETGTAVVEKNNEFKFAMRWPDKCFAHGSSPNPGPIPGKSFSANATPGGVLGPVTYTVFVHDPVPHGVRFESPPTTSDGFVDHQLKTFTTTVIQSRKAVAIGPEKRPGVEVFTQSPTGGPIRYERAVYAIHANRGYTVAAYSNGNPELLRTAEVDNFLASFEILD